MSLLERKATHKGSLVSARQVSQSPMICEIRLRWDRAHLSAELSIFSFMFVYGSIFAPRLKRLVCILTAALLLTFVGPLQSCTKTVYVHQQQQSYNDYKAHKYKKVKNKTKWPNRKKKKKNQTELR